MANAASNQTITTASTVIFNAKAGDRTCSEFFVGVRSTSSYGLQIQVEGLHNSDEWLGMPAGSSLLFKLNKIGLKKITVKGDGGSAVIDYGITGIDY
jgi:hypothetical protein